jgi:hypothetical protein
VIARLQNSLIGLSSLVSPSRSTALPVLAAAPATFSRAERAGSGSCAAAA